VNNTAPCCASQTNEVVAGVWQNGVLTPLGNLPGFNQATQGFGINSSGEVAGYAENNSGFSAAFLWQSGTMTNLGVLSGGLESFAYGINNSGQVVGYSDGHRNGKGFMDAFLWSSSTGMVDLGTLPGETISVASAINNNGHVVGYGGNPGGTAFFWSAATGLQDIGPGTATSINDSDQVVGWVGSGAESAFYWDPTNGMVNLNDLLLSPFASIGSFEPLSINNNGDIVAWVGSRGYLFAPTDQLFSPDQAGSSSGQGDPSTISEPTSLVLLITATLFAIGMRTERSIRPI
jgi:probable HAF family extracellular repeat protein